MASPEVEPRPLAGGVPVERVSLDNLPEACEVICQGSLVKQDLSGILRGPQPS